MRLGKLASAGVFAALLSAPLSGRRRRRSTTGLRSTASRTSRSRTARSSSASSSSTRAARSRGRRIRKSSADVRVRIDNNGLSDEQVGVAVVVFDAEGNVVAAGSNGTKWGYLNKGDRTYYNIDFPYVYRRLDQAATFIVTIETLGKPSKAVEDRGDDRDDAETKPPSPACRPSRSAIRTPHLRLRPLEAREAGREAGRRSRPASDNVPPARRDPCAGLPSPSFRACRGLA